MNLLARSGPHWVVGRYVIPTLCEPRAPATNFSVENVCESSISYSQCCGIARITWMSRTHHQILGQQQEGQHVAESATMTRELYTHTVIKFLTFYDYYSFFLVCVCVASRIVSSNRNNQKSVLNSSVYLERVFCAFDFYSMCRIHS